MALHTLPFMQLLRLCETVMYQWGGDVPLWPLRFRIFFQVLCSMQRYLLPWFLLFALIWFGGASLRLYRAKLRDFLVEKTVSCLFRHSLHSPPMHSNNIKLIFFFFEGEQWAPTHPQLCEDGVLCKTFFVMSSCFYGFFCFVKKASTGFTIFIL